MKKTINVTAFYFALTVAAVMTFPTAQTTLNQVMHVLVTCLLAFSFMHRFLRVLVRRGEQVAELGDEVQKANRGDYPVITFLLFVYVIASPFFVVEAPWYAWGLSVVAFIAAAYLGLFEYYQRVVEPRQRHSEDGKS